MQLNQRIPIRVALLIMGVAVLLAVACVWLAIGSSQSRLEVSFMDVGQGDATLIETPSGTDILIDGGRGGSVNRPLSRALPFYDRTIDLVIGTHADSDHIGGLAQTLSDYWVANIAVPVRVSKTDVWQAFQQASKKEVDTGAQVQRLSAGDVLRIGKETFLITLAPPAEAVPADGNDSSYVFKLVYGDTSLLLPGDISTSIETYLAQQYGSLLDADVLKVAHHGSKTSSSWPFLSAVSPHTAVISAGKDNRYGHPDQVVIDRLQSLQASTTCTCDVGTITVASDGREFKKLR